MDQLADTSKGHLILQGIEIARRAGAHREFGVCKVAFAQIAERRGYFEDAAKSAAEAVKAFEQVHFAVGVASASQWLGYLRLTRGYFADARVDLDRAVRAAQITRFTNVEAWARTGLAELYFTLGDVDAARANAERAATLHAAYGDLWGLAIDHQFEGVVADSRGR